MDETLNPRPSKRWPWLLWGWTTLFLAFLAVMTDLTLRKLSVHYEGMSLPLMLRLLIRWNSVVPFWLPVLAVSISGIPFARRGDVPRTQRWAVIVLFLTFLLVCVVMYAMVEPYTRMIRTMS